MLKAQSVAVIGASATDGKAGAAMWRSLQSFGHVVHPVNRSSAQIDGRTCYPTIRDVPEAVDLAVLTVPAAHVPRVVEDCAAAGVGGVVVCAGGFAESGHDGAALQRQLARTCAQTGIRVLGPNTSGFIVPASGLFATFMPGVAEIGAGGLAIVAQSGGVNLAASFMASELGVGLSLGVGLGNSVDVDFVDVLEYLAEDSGTSAIALHIEGVPNGRRLMEAVSKTVVTKPVVAFKVGRNDVGDFARSHTGAMAGDWAVARAALQDAGAVVVDTLTDLVEAAAALSVMRMPAHPRPSIGIVTGQAGPGLIMADQAVEAGAPVAVLSRATRRRLAELLPPLTYLENPVDTGRPEDSFFEVVTTVAADPAVDLTMVYALQEGSTGSFASQLTDRDGDALGAPLVMTTGGPRHVVVEQRAALHHAGVWMSLAPDRAGFVAWAMCEDARLRSRSPSRWPDGSFEPEPERSSAGAVSLSEADAKALLGTLGIRVPVHRVCLGLPEALAALDELNAPLVVKVLDPAITHKSAVGGVQLGVHTRAEMVAAVEATGRAATSVPAWLVEEQIDPGLELILGATRDPSFGLVMVVGPGGVDVELGPAPIMRMGPLDPVAAAEAIEKHPVLVNALAPADLAELAELMGRLSTYLEQHPEVQELEINPLRKIPAGYVALDAVVLVHPASDKSGFTTEGSD